MQCGSLNSNLFSIVRALSVLPILVVALKVLIVSFYMSTRNTCLSDVLQTLTTYELLYGKEDATYLEN